MLARVKKDAVSLMIQPRLACLMLEGFEAQSALLAGVQMGESRGRRHRGFFAKGRRQFSGGRYSVAATTHVFTCGVKVMVVNSAEWNVNSSLTF